MAARDDGTGAARRRRERRLRAMLRHQRVAVAMELATVRHHSFQRAPLVDQSVQVGVPWIHDFGLSEASDEAYVPSVPTAPTPVFEYVASGPVTEFMAPVPAPVFEHAAPGLVTEVLAPVPAPVAEYFSPAPAVHATHALVDDFSTSPAVLSASALVNEYETSAPVIESAASAPVEHETSAMHATVVQFLQVPHMQDPQLQIIEKSVEFLANRLDQRGEVYAGGTSEVPGAVSSSSLISPDTAGHGVFSHFFPTSKKCEGSLAGDTFS